MGSDIITCQECGTPLHPEFETAVIEVTAGRGSHAMWSWQHGVSAERADCPDCGTAHSFKLE